uniref:AMP-dependent synthetase/ligase domain-containing protein n=1 Tax=Stomoxys calcitrans TaxID=35570 RepID=A0A1I8NYI0_STOCA
MDYVVGTTYDEKEKVWSGPIVKDAYDSDMTLGKAIVMQLQKTPQKIIQIWDLTGETLTSQQFLDYSTALAKNMLKMGVTCPDVVGLYAQHSLHVGTMMMASFLCGTPVSGVFHGFEIDTVVEIYEKTRPKLIFCDAENYQNALGVIDHLQLEARIVLMTGCIEGVTNITELLSSNEKVWDISQFPCANLDGSATAAILCSSGTTGVPKAVMCSNQGLLHSNCYFTATCESTILFFSTMYWASGLITLISSLLTPMLRIVPCKPYSAEYCLHLLKHYKVTHFFTTSTQAAEVVLNYTKEEVRESYKSIDSILIGGSKVPQLIQEKLLDILSDHTQRPGLCVAYGMTEVYGGVVQSGRYPLEFKPMTEGKLFPNRKVCIVDEHNKRLGPNESGEILIFSPYIWLGYYNDPEATAKAMHGKWLRSGDVGYFDDEGFLHVISRTKEMFKWNNFQICPQPIEDVLLRLPGVAEVCVFPIPDVTVTNLAACAIVRTKNEEGLNLTVDTVHKFIDKHLDNVYHMRGGVYFVDSIPKTTSDKFIRQQVYEMIKANFELHEANK